MTEEISMLKNEVESEQAIEKRAKDRAKMKSAVKNILASIKRNEKAAADYNQRAEDDRKALRELTLENCSRWETSGLDAITGSGTLSSLYSFNSPTLATASNTLNFASNGLYKVG